ncbi:unnamed protein product [Brassicogethes aeneus]|uniref:Uncharacterized protein n=1 Tax=Brassicogethes aeneus TaxID=1431903 RepID=A0A9P0FAG2_BRAAE|nr:unnamed protein product [Brassicogethes aeneus]
MKNTDEQIVEVNGRDNVSEPSTSSRNNDNSERQESDAIREEQMMPRMAQVGNEVKNLPNKKRECVSEEDFDEAKKPKLKDLMGKHKAGTSNLNQDIGADTKSDFRFNDSINDNHLSGFLCDLKINEDLKSDGIAFKEASRGPFKCEAVGEGPLRLRLATPLASTSTVYARERPRSNNEEQDNKSQINKQTPLTTVTNVATAPALEAHPPCTNRKKSRKRKAKNNKKKNKKKKKNLSIQPNQIEDHQKVELRGQTQPGSSNANQGNQLDNTQPVSRQQSPGLSGDRLKRSDNDPNQAASSQRSSPDIDSDDEREKNTELFSAIKNGNMQKVQELRKAGLKVSIIDKNNKDNTPLHYAIEREKKEIAENLLQEWKADINAPNNKGNTPLHIATSKGNKELVQLLISKNASTNIKNNEVRTPLDIAKHLKRQDIVQILEPQIQPNLQASVGDNQQIGSSVQQRSDKKRPGIQGLHGVIYQLKLLMLFLKRGVDNQYSFRLSTEKKEANKFDDLFFEVTKNGKKEYRLLQAKHKADESKKITFDNLLTESDSDYSLVKYFLSYKDSKKEELFKNGIIKHVTVCTNINLDLDDKYELNGVSKTIREVVQKIEEKDNILDIDSEMFAKEAVRYRFSDNVALLLKPKLEHYNWTRLARRLAECFLKNNSIQHHQEHDIFKVYHTVLAKEVIHVKDEKFHDKFIENKGISEDTQKFREAFAKEIKKQSKGALTLEHINLAISERKVVDNKQVGLKLSNNFGSGEDKNWPNNAISDKDVNDFLDCLVFAVNQPNEDQLGKIIENEISKEFNFAAKDYVYKKLFEKMLEWLNGKEEEFFSYQDGKSFFEETKQELELIRLTLEYESKVKKFGLEFNSDAVQEIELFLAAKDTNKQVFNAITQQNTLSAIKVYQVLQNKNYIFMQLNSILHLQNRVIQAFEGSSNLLVIDCKTKEKEEDIQILYDQLSSIIQSSSNKKVVLITQGNDLLANKFKSTLKNKYQEKIDEKNSLLNLNPNSQKIVLEKGKVIFLGEEGVNLGKLVNNIETKKLIDGEVLSKLVNLEEVKIGKALIDSKYEDIKDYYIPRTFNRQVKIKELLKNKDSGFLVTDSNKSDKLKLQEDQDIVLISDTKEGFKHLCDNHKKHNIHWLKQEGDDLIWQKSYGTLSKLRKFVDTNSQAIQEYKPEGITDIKDRVVIISAEPGMGKSTVLTPLALKAKDSLWAVRINLLDYSNEFKREIDKKTKLNEAEAIKFLYRIVCFQLFQGGKEETTEKKEERKQTIEKVLSLINVKDSEVVLRDYRERIQGLNLFEIKLFNNFYNQGKIALLFDGFDEISPDYTEKVIELLQVLKNSKVQKLWITTRPYNFIQGSLEDKLSVFSYSLKPLLLEEQKGFLRKFWKEKLKLNELDEQRSGVFIDELLGKLPKSIDFMSIPLHASMVAEVFKDAFKSFYDSNEQELSDEHKREIEEKDLATLYDRFINIKFYKIRFKEKKPGMNNYDPDLISMVDKELKKFKEDHFKLALYAIFNEIEVEELLSQEEIGKVTELIEKIKEAKEKSGIIDIIINDKPRFVHLTFAEYFVASYFWESFNSVQFDKFEDFVENIIIKNLIKDDRIEICKFLQLKAKKDSNINLPDKLRTLLTKLLDQTTQYNHKGNGKQSTKLLFGIVEFSFSTNNVDVIENNDQLKLLCVSAEMGYIKLVEALETTLNNRFLKEYLNYDKWFYSPLWLAAQNAHLDVLKILVENFSYKSSWKDQDSNTLVQRIFETDEFDVLRSCLKLDIVDGKPYKDLNNQQALPIVEVFKEVAPSDVIELLIEKTDSNLVNGFKYLVGSSQISAAKLIAVQSLKYDKEITELAINKGIDFSDVTNLLLYEYGIESLNSPLNKLIYARHSQLSFHSDKEFLNLFERIELLLKAGVGYNYFDIQYSRFTLQYAEQIHYIHKLLYRVHKFHINKSSNPLGTILKLIIDNVCSSPDKGYKFVWSHQQDISLLLFYKDKSSKCNRSIQLLPKPHNIPKLLSKFYEDSNVNLVENALGKVREYITNAKEEIKAFKQYSGSKIYNKILIGYEEMLGFNVYRKEEAGSYQSLDEHEKDLLEWVLNLYIRQDYKINDALKEVEEEVLRFKEIINKLKENSDDKKYNTEEILDILAIKSIDTNEELQNLISNIYECGGIEFLSKTWSKLYGIGQQRIMGILELMFKFADQSSKIFELLKKLDASYKKLTKAIENKDYQKINNILQDIEPDFIKAIINGQDDEYGSPLHYAASEGDEKATTILLERRANPNLKMQGNGVLLSTAEQDFQGCTPLHVAVFNGQLEVAEILVKYGADVNAMSTGWQGETPLHMAVQSGKLDVIEFLVAKGAKDKFNAKLEVVQFLLKNKADPNIQDKNGKTALDLAQERLSQDRENDNLKTITDLLLSVTDESQHQEEQRLILLEECLPSTRHSRRKREDVEDVDEFNEEKDEKRDFSKIKIDSEKFVSYIKDLP